MGGKRGSRHVLEAQEQRNLIEWAHLSPHPFLPGVIGDYLFAIPNGAHLSSPKHAQMLKLQGLKPGVYDLFLPNKVHKWGGLWIEMKRRRESFDSPSRVRAAISPEQSDWGRKMEMCGYVQRVCYGWPEAQQAIEDYLRHGG